MSNIKNRYIRKYDSTGKLLYSKSQNFDIKGNLEIEEIYDDNLFEDNRISKIYKLNKLVKEVFLNSDTFIEYSANSQIAIKISKTTNNYLYDSIKIEEQKKKLSPHYEFFNFSNLFQFYLNNYVIEQINFQSYEDKFIVLELDILGIDTIDTEVLTNKFEYQIDKKLISEEFYSNNNFGYKRIEYKYLDNIIISSHFEDGYHLFDSINKTIKGEQRNCIFEANLIFSKYGKNFLLSKIEIIKDYKNCIIENHYLKSNDSLQNEKLVFTLAEISNISYEYIKEILPIFKLVYKSNQDINSSKDLSYKETINYESDVTEKSTYNYIFGENRKLLNTSEFSCITTSTKSNILISIITNEYY